MNIKITNLRLIPMLFLGLIYGCSPTVKVTTDYDHAANFSEYKTFSVYDLKAQEGQVNQLNVDRVTKAIRNEMISKGFTESTTNPDLKVNAVTILKNKTQVTADSNFYGYGGMYRPYGYWGSGAMMGGEPGGPPGGPYGGWDRERMERERERAEACRHPSTRAATASAEAAARPR